jgi:Ser/Thr protein kinase RdoA (MazF antagonist)
VPALDILGASRSLGGRRAMIVEVCGEPGAGKSSVLPMVIALMRERGMDAMTATAAVDRGIARGWLARAFRALGAGPLLQRGRGRRFLVELPWSVLVILRFPGAIVRGTAAILRQPVGWRHRAVIFHRFMLPLARLAFLRGRLNADEVAVIDEGPVHRVVNLFAWRHTAASDSEVRAYVQDLPPIDVLVVVQAPTELARARLDERGLPRYLRARSVDVVDRFLAHARRALDVAIGEMSDRSMVIHVDNGGTRADLRRALSHALDEVLSARTASAGRPLPVFEPRFHFRVPRPDRLGVRSRDVDGALSVDALVEAFGLRARGPAQPVGRGRSRTALVPTDAGMVLIKRYKASLSDAAIACEHAILLEAARQGLPTPRLVPSPDGTTLVRHGDDRAAAFEAVSGYTPLHERVAWPGESIALAALCGTTLAVLHDALEAFWPATVNPIGLGPTGQRLVPTEWHRDQLRRRRSGSDASVADLTAAFPWVDDRLRGLDAEIGAANLATTNIHGDYAPYNILSRPGMPLLPIDFELARPDWRATDIAAAIPRFARSRLRFDRGRARAFLAGYLDAARWDRHEVALLPTVGEFLALRRLAVCWSRWTDGADRAVLEEVRFQLDRARSLANGSDPMVRVCR